MHIGLEMAENWFDSYEQGVALALELKREATVDCLRWFQSDINQRNTVDVFLACFRITFS